MTKIELLQAEQRTELNLLRIRQALDVSDLIKSGEQDMPVSADTAAVISAFDVATTAIADRIARLVAGQTGLSADDKAAFQTEIDKLTALGQDPANPIPPVA